MGVEELGELNPIFLKTFSIDNLSNNDWRRSVIEFLKNPMGTTNQKIKYEALSYVIVRNKLFKNMHEGVLLKFLRESKTYLAIFSAHSRSCGANQVGYKMKRFLF